jgi:hypothetical protein
MTRKVTYLFGAGASAGVVGSNRTVKKSMSCLPLVTQFPDRFASFRGEIGQAFLQECRPEIEKLREVEQALRKHASIDTYAKILYLSGRKDELRALKIFLSLFFIWEQFHNGLDPRYDLFFASIMQGKMGNIYLPKNVKILSWNYDNQFELSATKFYQKTNASEVREALSIFPSPITKGGLSEESGFGIFKLNGSADLFIRPDDSIDKQVDLRLTSESLISKTVSSNADWRVGIRKELRYILKSSNLIDKIKDSMVSYAWEDEQKDINACRKDAISSISGSGVLVVVGYSFPTFNREIDKKILEAFFTDNMDPKIYVQADPSNVTSIITRILALYPHRYKDYPKPVAIDGLEEFYVPAEFDGVYK